MSFVEFRTYITIEIVTITLILLKRWVMISVFGSVAARGSSRECVRTGNRDKKNSKAVWLFIFLT